MAIIEPMTPAEEVKLRLAAGISPSTSTEYMLRHIPLWVKMSILRRNTLSTPFTPRHLFVNGVQGVWYDPSDISTLFQDAAGTTPVTASGQPVGLMLDKSGIGNHASQSVSARRPLYMTDGTLHWLQFDGTDDVLISAPVDLSGTDKVSTFVGVTPKSGGRIIQSSGKWQSVEGTFTVQFGDSGTILIGSRADIRRYRPLLSFSPYKLFDRRVLSAYMRFGNLSAVDALSLRVDGQSGMNPAHATGESDTTKNFLFSKLPLYIGGEEGENKMNGDIYQAIVLGGAVNTQNTQNMEKYTAEKVGVTLL